ncbi:excinuclease ABC subunit UvrA [Candidatus Gracilibacteria bacterium]|nr:excinuclease ABC subunit UvrA [Candidatus Gracilibacteria bacterium]
MSEFLEIYGARTHNLKNINLKIPKNQMVVFTGLSGSGKSSLAFNTIYSVGQQKYLESLSSYARMFIGGMKEEALVDEIKGLSPTISIDQKTTNRNPRSTVGTITEIYDYYKLLYLNIGVRKCIKCENIIKKDSLKQVLSDISSFEKETRFMIKAQIFCNKSGITKDYVKKEVLDNGFIRFSLNDVIYTVNDEFVVDEKKSYNLDIVIDRLTVKDYSDDESSDTKRLKDSLDLAFKTGNGFIKIYFMTNPGVEKKYSNKFVCSKCGHIPEELDISSFSFNSHKGACPDCHGLGVQTVFLEENIINPRLSLEEGAVIVHGFGSYFLSLIQSVGEKHNIRTRVPYSELTKKERDLVLNGTGSDLYKVKYTNDAGNTNTYTSKFEGVINTLNRRFFDNSNLEAGKLDDFVTEIECPVCEGKRLKSESLSIYINGLNIGDLSELSVGKSLDFIKNLKLNAEEDKTVKNVLKNARERLEFLAGVGLEYITISRKTNTLSGGEAQRIRLATQIGVKLEGIIYVLDEPSIGLHPRDNDMLINNLKKLRDIGNTLLIVEHDEDIMKQADYIIDIGPGAGIHGGNIIATGTYEEIINNKNSVTGPYLSGEKEVVVERNKRKKDKFLSIFGASHNNLKNIDVHFPAGNLTVVTGVSGSGKSSLVNDILANYLANELNRASKQFGKFKSIEGLENFDKVLVIDQSPIGKTPRSNPATYTGVFTNIREVFSMSYESQVRGYGPGRFSFNTREGRCEACEGDGVKKIEMHFLPPVYVECEECNGKRFNPETLAIKYKGKSIADVLDMTVEEATSFFLNHKKISNVLGVLNDVGLSYIKLGQSSTTLSGGEAQRIKLATELSKRSTSKTIFILDEPTTGLHFQDVEKLLKILHSLVDKGNTVIIIEHNMNVILNSDYIIDIGPNGGDSGGNLVVAGDIEEVKKCKESFTAVAINKYLG